MMDRINAFNDAGMVVVQTHTFCKPHRVLWAMSTPEACQFYRRMPPSFVHEHPLLLKYNEQSEKAYKMGKHLTKCIGISMGLYPQFKTRY